VEGKRGEESGGEKREEDRRSREGRGRGPEGREGGRGRRMGIAHPLLSVKSCTCRL